MSENQDDQQTGKDLRSQLEQALAENKTLKDQLVEGTDAKRELAFRDAGINTREGTGKLLAKTYDGELDSEAIATFAKEYGVDVTEQQESKTEELDPTQQRVENLKSETTSPSGAGKRMSTSEFLELTRTDPQAALQARRDGMVDVAPQMEQQLAQNRQTVRLG